MSVTRGDKQEPRQSLEPVGGASAFCTDCGAIPEGVKKSATVTATATVVVVCAVVFGLTFVSTILRAFVGHTAEANRKTHQTPRAHHGKRCVERASAASFGRVCFFPKQFPQFVLVEECAEEIPWYNNNNNNKWECGKPETNQQQQQHDSRTTPVVLSQRVSCWYRRARGTLSVCGGEYFVCALWSF